MYKRQFLYHPDDNNTRILHEKVSKITVGLPVFFKGWLTDTVKENLIRMSYMGSDSTQVCDSIHPSRLSMLTKKLSKKK